MTIYVDDVFMNRTIGSHTNRWCHMATDSHELTELRQMAKRIGLNIAYLQFGGEYYEKHGNKLAHYDITPGKRAMAIHFGAVAVASREVVVKCGRMKKG